VGQNTIKNTPEPKIVVGNQQIYGIRHLSPVSVASFCSFSESGNLGRSVGKTEIKDLANAHLEIGLSTAPLDFQELKNSAMVDYMAWLNALTEKFVQHLAENIQEYPLLARKLGKINRESIPVVLQASHVRNCIYTPRDPKYAPYVALKTKLYKSAGKKEIKTYCDSDVQMKERKLQRSHIPLYHIENPEKEVPISEAAVHFGDVIIAQSTLRPVVDEIGSNLIVKLRQDLRSVVLVKAKESVSGASKSSPFVMQ